MNNTKATLNKAILFGRIVTQPKFDFQKFDEKFYSFTLEVSRESGNKDILPIITSECLLHTGCILIDSFIQVRGQIRTWNKVNGNKSKLMVQVFATDIIDTEVFDVANDIELEGTICKQPVYRTTPLGRDICDIILAVNRRYGKSNYIPCIVWGRNAKFASTLQIGDKIHVDGRLQSREYEKAIDGQLIETRMAYEVSVSRITTIKEGD